MPCREGTQHIQSYFCEKLLNIECLQSLFLACCSTLHIWRALTVGDYSVHPPGSHDLGERTTSQLRLTIFLVSLSHLIGRQRVVFRYGSLILLTREGRKVLLNSSHASSPSSIGISRACFPITSTSSTTFMPQGSAFGVTSSRAL